MKKRVTLLFLVNMLNLLNNNAKDIDKKIINHFSPTDKSFQYSRYISFGGKNRIMYIFYVKQVDAPSNEIKRLDESIELLERLSPRLIHYHHLTFGGKNGTIICTYLQKIEITTTKTFVIATNHLNKKFIIIRPLPTKL